MTPELEARLTALAHTHTQSDPEVAAILYTVCGSSHDESLPTLYRIVTAFAIKRHSEDTKLMAMERSRP